jgi:hypothetical protein
MPTILTDQLAHKHPNHPNYSQSLASFWLRWTSTSTLLCSLEIKHFLQQILEVQHVGLVRSLLHATATATTTWTVISGSLFVQFQSQTESTSPQLPRNTAILSAFLSCLQVLQPRRPMSMPPRRLGQRRMAVPTLQRPLAQATQEQRPVSYTTPLSVFTRLRSTRNFTVAKLAATSFYVQYYTTYLGLVSLSSATSESNNNARCSLLGRASL